MKSKASQIILSPKARTLYTLLKLTPSIQPVPLPFEVVLPSLSYSICA